jgi:DNA repair exonuclease SbcCD nuclease subunit
VRVLFVSDTHLGIDMPNRPRIERRRRGDDFLRNYKRALDVARGSSIDVVVHGGDLLFRSQVRPWLAEMALAPLRELAASGVPVLLLAGNHERSSIPYPLLALQDGLHVFDRPRTVALEARGVRVAFVGFPYAPDVRTRFPELLAAATHEAPDADVRVLCLHQAVEGATCGPGNFTFRFGPEVIRARDLPGDVAVTLSGHIHRHQVLRLPGLSPVIYAGSTERTSFAEAAETKGFVVLELTRSGLGSFEFCPLPARPMVRLTLSLDGGAVDAHARLATAIASTPDDAVVQVRVTGAMPALPTAAALRAMAGARTVSLTIRGADRAYRRPTGRPTLGS